MSIKTEYDILGLGNPFCDRSAYVEDSFLDKHQLKKGETTFTADSAAISASWNATQKLDSEFVWSLGGSGANVTKTLAHFGNKCAIYGKIGSGDIGRKIAERLHEIGITSLLSKGEQDTGIVNCFITPDAQRTMHASFGVSVEFSERDILPEIFQNSKHVHLEGYSACFGEALGRSIDLAEGHATISLDLASQSVVERFKHLFQKYIPRVNFLFGNLQEMAALTGCETISKVFECFSPSQTVVATDGEKGCWVKNSGESDAVHYDAIHVLKVKDTTGAGDFFDAGFLHGALKGKDVAQCVKMGNLAASFVIAEEGADLPKDKWEQLTNLISQV